MFPLFAHIHQVLRKVEVERASILILITPICHSQTWYPDFLQLSKETFLYPLHTTKFRGRSSYPGKKQDFTVSSLESFRTRLSDEEVSKGAPNLIAASRRDGTLRPGKSELAGVCKTD